jgi:hypothetical protein
VVLRHYRSQLDLHHVLVNFNVVHIVAERLNDSAASNFHQLVAGLHSMQEYARFILGQGHVWHHEMAVTKGIYS